MNTTMKKIVLSAAVAAMAMSAIGISASAAEKQPGEAGCNYVNEYGKHPGESGFCYTDTATAKPSIKMTAQEAGYAFLEVHPECKVIGAELIQNETECFYRVYAEMLGAENGPRMAYHVDEFSCFKEYEKKPGEAGYGSMEESPIPEEGKQPGYLKATEDAVKAFIADHPEYEIVKTAILLSEDNCFYRIDAEVKGVANGPTMIFLVNDQICRKVDEKLPGQGNNFEEEITGIGYDPSLYTGEQIKQIEAFRAENGFISVTLLLKFDEENAAAQANAEKKPGEAGYNYVNENGKHPGECGFNYTDGEETAAEGKQPGESGCNYVNENGKHPGESGFCYDANELGYDPSKYTEDQIRLIEASRELNGFVCGTLLEQFDEENAAAAKAEEKPQHALGLKVFGDVNCNGEVDVTDSVLLSRFIAEDKTVVLSEQGKINADMNGDGRLTMEDNALILNLIAKMN